MTEKLEGFQRKYLRGLAHKRKPAVLVARRGSPKPWTTPSTTPSQPMSCQTEIHRFQGQGRQERDHRNHRKDPRLLNGGHDQPHGHLLPPTPRRGKAQDNRAFKISTGLSRLFPRHIPTPAFYLLSIG
jgi:hypothetical protein